MSSMAGAHELDPLYRAKLSAARVKTPESVALIHEFLHCDNPNNFTRHGWLTLCRVLNGGLTYPINIPGEYLRSIYYLFREGSITLLEAEEAVFLTAKRY